MIVVSAMLTRGCVLTVVFLWICHRYVLWSEVADVRSDETPFVRGSVCVWPGRQSVACLLDFGRLGFGERGRIVGNVCWIKFGCGHRKECTREQGGRGTGQIHASTA